MLVCSSGVTIFELPSLTGAACVPARCTRPARQHSSLVLHLTLPPMTAAGHLRGSCSVARRVASGLLPVAARAWCLKDVLYPNLQHVMLQVTCLAAAPGLLSSVLECYSQGGRSHHLAVTAMVAAPMLALDAPVLELGASYVGVRVQRSVLLRNLTQLPTGFAWEAGGYGDEGQLTVDVEPQSGMLSPGEAARSRCKAWQPPQSLAAASAVGGHAHIC